MLTSVNSPLALKVSSSLTLKMQDKVNPSAGMILKSKSSVIDVSNGTVT